MHPGLFVVVAAVFFFCLCIRTSMGQKNYCHKGVGETTLSVCETKICICFFARNNVRMKNH